MDKKSKTWKKIDELVDSGDSDMSSESMLRFLGLDSNLLKELESQSMENVKESVNLEDSVTIKRGDVGIINTGLSFELPENYEMQIRPRSGLAAKNGITVLNTPGTVDRGYTGEIKVILINLGKKDFMVSNGDRVAQAVIAPVLSGRWCILENKNKLTKTKRGESGFGSTGIK